VAQEIDVPVRGHRLDKGVEMTKIPASVKLQATGLMLAALGTFLEFLVGVPGFPDVPPGPIILGVAGVLVVALAGRWRRIVIVGLLVSLFITVGGIAEGSSWDRLGNVGEFGFFITTLIQWVGLAIADIAGSVALGYAFTSRSRRQELAGG
jgi:hypothetical protein